MDLSFGHLNPVHIQSTYGGGGGGGGGGVPHQPLGGELVKIIRSDL